MDGYCPCCGTKTVRLLCRVASIPVMVNQICRNKEEAGAVLRGDISLVRCEACGTVWNCDYHPEKLVYDAQYDNSQDLGLEYQAHFRRMVDFLSSNVELEGKKVLEIGCGKGRFLTCLAEETGCAACGVDPSYLGEEKSADGRCTFIKKVYNRGLAQTLGEGAFDCIVMRQVFDQLPDPRGMMRNAAFNLCEGGYLYVEGLEFQNLLDQRSILDLSYERYTYFTVESLERFMLDACIEQMASANSFQGQYMAVLGRKNAGGCRCLKTPESSKPSRPWVTAQDLRRAGERLEELKKVGKIAVWGAANRGVMFCSLLDAECTLIDCVIDILPAKQGGFLPGSGHPVVAPAELEARGIRWVVAANQNYVREIRAQMQGMGSRAGLLTAGEILRLN